MAGVIAILAGLLVYSILKYIEQHIGCDDKRGHSWPLSFVFAKLPITLMEKQLAQLVEHHTNRERGFESLTVSFHF